LCELFLSKPRALAKLVDLARDRIVGFRLGKVGHALWAPFVVAAMDDVDRFSCRNMLAVLFHFRRSLLKGVEPGVFLVPSLSRQRHLDGSRGNSVLFGQPVGKNRGDSVMKKIEDPIVDMVQTDPQFMNAIAQQVGFGPPQLVTKFGEPLDFDPALVLGLGWKAIEPFEHRRGAIGLPIEDNPGSRHLAISLSRFRKIAKLSALNPTIQRVELYKVCIRDDPEHSALRPVFGDKALDI